MSSLKKYFESTMNGKKLPVEEEMQYEVLRLASFDTWPEWAVKRPVNLAAHGFYYCGDKDRVKCFSCGGEISDWSFWQNIADEHKQRFPQCPFVCGLAHNNMTLDSVGAISNSPANADLKTTVDELLKTMETDIVFSSGDALHHNQQKQLPINWSESKAKLQESQQHRLDTFIGQWRNNSAPTPAQLARAGFYYVGPADTVECAFCNGKLLNWKPSDDPLIEHKKHYPSCSFVADIPVVRNMFQNEAKARTAINVHARPEYATEEARLESFIKWPKNATVSSKALSAAGFYYLGYSDNVKCFSCNGGLRNWEMGDDPWREHAHWFSNCAFLKQIKGEQYIQDTINHFSRSPEVTETSNQHSGECSQGTSCSQAAASRKIEEQKNKDLTNTSAERKESGLSRRQKKNRNRKKKSSQSSNESTSGDKLIQFSDNQEFGINHEVEIEQPGMNHERNKDESGMSHNWKSADLDPNHEMKEDTATNFEAKNDDEGTVANQYKVKDVLAAAIERIKEERMCKICMDAPCNIVLLPCRHMMCCSECAPALRTCPLCRGHIKETLRVYVP